MNKRDLFRLINGTFDDLFSHYNYLRTPKGETKNESGNDELGEWSKTTFSSEDGSMSYTTFVRHNLHEYPISSKKDKLYELKQDLEKHIEKQEFEKAAELRDRIKLLEKNSESINQLKKELKDLVEKQDFEQAAKVRDKIKELEK